MGAGFRIEESRVLVVEKGVHVGMVYVLLFSIIFHVSAPLFFVTVLWFLSFPRITRA